MDRELRKKQHLMARAGFGLAQKDWKEIHTRSLTQVQKGLFNASQAANEIWVTQERLPHREMMAMSMLSKEERQEQGRKLLAQLNVSWIHQMAQTDGQLREKMTLFWHDHFACHLKQIYTAQAQHNTLRRHALGKFKDLLLAISKDPGMLLFLNNQQNRKQHPNENFARELLELFTLGRGHYTEYDIKEAARAFTGWGIDREGNFVFRKRQHDDGKKTFMGKRGNFTGEDILDILLENPQTAYFLTQKVYRYFVNAHPHEESIHAWSRDFYASGYDIAALMERIFSSAHFYEKQNMGTRIKSPIEYLVSLMRVLDMTFPTEETPIFIQKGLGQVLFQPPNVAGWPDGRAWIDGTSLVSRLQIPQGLIWFSEMNLRGKASYAGKEDSFQLPNINSKRSFKGNINWNGMLKNFRGKPKEKILEELSACMLNVPYRYIHPQQVTRSIRGRKPEWVLKQLCTRVLCTPEFQMC